MEKISICSNRGGEESVGNDDVSIVCARKYEMVQDDVKTENPEGTTQADFVTFIVQSYFDTPCVDILWSSCFESYGPKDTR